MVFNPNEVMNGTYGTVYDENGQDLSTTQEFTASVEFEKQDIIIPGQLMKGNKVTGASGKGSVNFLKVDSRLQKKIAENPTAKYNYIGKLADPTARGEESVLLIGVSFDGAPIGGFKMGELAEVDLDFTFDNYRYLEAVE